MCKRCSKKRRVSWKKSLQGRLNKKSEFKNYIEQYISVKENENMMKDLRESTKEEISSVKRNMVQIWEENDRLKELLNKQKTHEVERESRLY